MGEIFANLWSDMGLMQKIYKELIQFENKTNKNRKGQRN